MPSSLGPDTSFHCGVVFAKSSDEFFVLSENIGVTYIYLWGVSSCSRSAGRTH